MNDFSQRLHLYGLTPEIITQLASSLITSNLPTCVCSGVSLQVEGVVESFPAECAEISLDVTVTLHVPVKKSLKGESFATNPAAKLAGVHVTSLWWKLLRFRSGRVQGQRIFDSVTSIDEF